MEDESEDEYSDDDDMSWKVRRAAAKCLEAVISTRHELLEEFYRTVSPKLIARYAMIVWPVLFSINLIRILSILVNQVGCIAQG